MQTPLTSLRRGGGPSVRVDGGHADRALLVVVLATLRLRRGCVPHGGQLADGRFGSVSELQNTVGGDGGGRSRGSECGTPRSRQAISQVSADPGGQLTRVVEETRLDWRQLQTHLLCLASYCNGRTCIQDGNGKMISDSL